MRAGDANHQYGVAAVLGEEPEGHAVTIFFPDISAFQAGIDLAGAKAVCIKATEGTSWHNPDYGRAKTNAAGHGTFVMAYHFLHDGAAGVQANWCHGGGPGWGGVGGTPLMIDCEPSG